MANGSTTNNHESALINAFVVRERKERLLYLVANPNRRKKFIDELGHFRWFDPRFATKAKWTTEHTVGLWDRHNEGIANILRLLKSKGAGETCWVISQFHDADGREMQLGAALEKIIGSGMGSILSCVPGRLAYFEGEDESLVLNR